MIVNPILSGGGSGGSTVVGSCTLYDPFGVPKEVPIYQGIPPLDMLAIFSTDYDVVQMNGETAEYISWAALASGNYMLYRGVQDGDSFRETM